MINFNDLPMIPGQNTRPVTQISADQLKEVGVNNSLYAIRKGDKLVFDATDAPVVVAQAVRENDANSPKAYYVGCTRNNKPSWVGIGIFTRRDAHAQPLGEIQSKALGYANFADVYTNLLSGKTIVCDDIVEKEMAAFDRTTGQRLAENRKTMVPHLKYE